MEKAFKTNPSFRYYMHDGAAAFSFELSGVLTDDAAATLETAWRTASSVMGRRRLVVDVTYLTGAGASGRELLRRWHAGGARLVAQSAAARSLLKSITGLESITGAPAAAEAPSPGARHSTWLPYRTAGALAVLFAMLLVPMRVAGANLKPATASACTPPVIP